MVAESDVELALALGVGRRRVSVPFVSDSAGVELREADCVRWVRYELDTRSVVVDTESELTDPLGYGVVGGRAGSERARSGLKGLGLRGQAAAA